MSIEILKAGVLDTVQDTGRPGYRKWGIGPGGVMDRSASRIASALVGNDVNAAVVEMHFPAPELMFHRDALVAITGADMEPMLHGHPIPAWKPVIVKAGNVLTFRRRNAGVRCYLAVRGGLAIAPWLGSRSTNLKIKAGGVGGRALKKSDLLPLMDDLFPKNISGAFKVLPWGVNSAPVYGDRDAIFFIPGHEWNWLSEASQAELLSGTFVIQSSSDRMAYHLAHTALTFRKKQEMLSSAVCAGTIQALPAGKLLVLMADHQTTGGYPNIGHVATAHLPRLAQMNAGEMFRLKRISVEESEKMLLSLERAIRSIHESCCKKLEAYEAVHRSEL